MNSGKGAAIFIGFLFLLIALSAGATYYRYMVLGDFVYFLTEEEIPDRFDLASYQGL